MGESYYIVYSKELEKIYWFMRKEKADQANLFAIKQYVENHKQLLFAEEIFLNTKNATLVKSLLKDNGSMALELIRSENEDAVSIQYPDGDSHNNN